MLYTTPFQAPIPTPLTPFVAFEFFANLDDVVRFLVPSPVQIHLS